MVDLDGKIEFLASSHPDIVISIDDLKRRHVELMNELGQVEKDLVAEEQKLAYPPGTIATMREQRDSIPCRAQVLREQKQPIPGSIDADRKKIEAVNQFLLDLINVVHLLGIV
jgi:hypothetical protein